MRRTLFASVLAAVATASPSQSSLPSQSFHTEDFTVPELNITVNTNPSPGFIFLGTLGKGDPNDAPIIYTNDGDLVWYGGQVVTHNFRVQVLDDNDVLTYWTGFGDVFGHGYGSIDIFDNTYKQLYSVCLKDNIVVPNPSKPIGPCYFDGHESFLTNRSTVIGTAFNVTPHDLTPVGGPANGWIFDALFYEVDIKTNEIVFSWSALDHINITDSKYLGPDPSDPLHIANNHFGGEQAEPWDFFHINSVQAVNGGYLVNSRMTWSMYFVNGDTGEVEWTLEGSKGGDFTLDKNIFWSWQHDPRILSSDSSQMTISLFANNNINQLRFLGINATKGYLLNVNMDTKEVQALKHLVDPTDRVKSPSEGNYQALDNGNAFLGYGGKAVFKEFDNQTNDVVYSVNFAGRGNSRGGVDDDNGKKFHSYRTYRFDWDGFPTTKPKAAAIVDDVGMLTAYMSWNGATTYDSWNVYAGSSKNSLQMVASGVPKNGFETGKSIGSSEDGITFVQVEALNGNTSLGKSTKVQVQTGQAAHNQRKNKAQS